MISRADGQSIGVLMSGGLDSSILVSRLLNEGRRVLPFYIQSDLCWQRAELAAVQQYLDAVRTPTLGALVLLRLPLADLYGEHWSITGRAVPGAETPDEAVFLPGRNALLLIKAALWCQLHAVGQLALATLGTSPFEDATRDFFHDLQAALNRSGIAPLRIVRPFAALDKRQVMQLGRDYPLDLTFSCISPIDRLHCGRCNKCAERRSAFDLIPAVDRTEYADQAQAGCAMDA